MTVREVPEAYAETVGAVNARLRQNPEGPAGDPERAAGILARLARHAAKHAEHAKLPEHLPLGVHAAEYSIQQDRDLLAADLAWREVSRSADFGEPYPVPFPC
jgi:hypothetical protein